MNHYKKILTPVALVLLSFFGTLLLVEYCLQATAFSGYLPAKSPPNYIEADPQLLYRITPNYPETTQYGPGFAFKVWSNSLGCFDEEPASKNIPVYLTGDSFTWGYAPFEDKWGTRISQLLGLAVAKCGVGGYGTSQELAKATEDLTKLNPPELIVVGYFENDLYDDTWLLKTGSAPGKMWSCSPKTESSVWNKTKCYLYLHSILYNFGSSLSVAGARKLLPKQTAVEFENFISAPTPPGILPTPETVTFHQNNIVKFKDLAHMHGSKLLFVLLPSKEETAGGSTRTDSSARKAALISFLEEHRILYADLAPAFQAQAGAQPLYWERDPHFNVAGNHLAGLLVSQYIVDHNLVTLPDKEKAAAAIQSALDAFGK